MSKEPRSARRTTRGSSHASAAREPTAGRGGDTADPSGSSGVVKSVLGFTLGTGVGWVAYVFSALVVLNYLVRLDATVTVIPGLSPTTTLWIAGGVLVAVTVAVFARPLTVCVGWLLMAGLVAAAVTYLPSQQGFTQTVTIVEGLTLGLAGVAAFVKVMLLLPEGPMFGLLLARRL